MSSHFVWLVADIAAHFKTNFILCLKLLEIHPKLHATFVLTERCLARYHKELALQPKSLLELVGPQMKTKVLLPDPEADMFLRLGGADGLWEDALKAIITSETDAKNGQPDDGWAMIPSAFLADIFLLERCRPIVDENCRAIGIDTIPVLSSCGSSVQGHQFLCAAADDGGLFGYALDRFRQLTSEGMDEQAAAQGALLSRGQVVLNFPGLPPMFDYEFLPQRLPDSPIMWSLLVSVETALRNHDGWVVASTPEIEQDLIDWTAMQIKKPVISVGPMINDFAWGRGGEVNGIASAYAVVPPPTPGTEEAIVEAFLDDALVRYGPNSAAYISFGSRTWPQRPEIIDAIIDTLLATEPAIPFIFAVPPSPLPRAHSLLPRVREKILSKESEGRGLLLEWAPQVRILTHQATGMFLSHCGTGSLYESIAAGVPILGLPFDPDQPGLAAHFLNIQGCGEQLYQLNPNINGRSTAGGVRVDMTKDSMEREMTAMWKKFRGPAGDGYRENVNRVRAIMWQSMKSGQAKEGLQSFSKYFRTK